jgi:hypothetical protein
MKQMRRASRQLATRYIAIRLLLDNAGDDADANRKCDVSHLRIIIAVGRERRSASITQ